jgi:hypothetical protein
VKYTMLIDILRLRDHEEVDPFRFKELMKEMIDDGFQRDPIIVDEKSGVVLDGHHRRNILKTLGYSKIASYQVQYVEDDKIRVKTWYLVVVDSKKRLIETIDDYGIELTPSTKNNSKNLLVLKGRTFQLGATRREVINALAGKIKFQYVSTKNIALRLVKDGGAAGAFIFEPVTKEDVLKVALSSDPFPPKTTRHIIPSRPKNWFIPLKKLK